MNTLHFCRDGILRRTMRTCIDDGENWTTSCLPVQAWEASVDKNIFLKTLHDTVIFEDGLIVGELFANLEPWAEQMTGVACMDFPAFLNETRHEAKPDNDLAEIIMKYDVFIKTVPDFDRNDIEKIENDDSESDRFLKLFGKPMKTGRLEVETCWSMSAILHPEHRHKFNGEKSVSLSLSSINEWQHLPISFKSTANMHDETACGGDTAIFLGTDQSLTKADHQNVEVIKSSKGTVMDHRISIDPPMPTFFDAVVQGFLWDVGYFYSPTQRDVKRDEIRDSMAEIDRKKDLAEMSDEDLAEMDAGDMNEGPSEDERAEYRTRRQFVESIRMKASEMGLHVEPDVPDEDDPDVCEIPK